MKFVNLCNTKFYLLGVTCPVTSVGFGQCPIHTIGHLDNIQMDICPIVQLLNWTLLDLDSVQIIQLDNWTIGYYLYELLNLICDLPKITRKI